jgi:hypothetical protein
MNDYDDDFDTDDNDLAPDAREFLNEARSTDEDEWEDDDDTEEDT